MIPEIEFIPTVVGFSVGTAVCLISRLFVARRSSEPPAPAKAEQAVEQEADVSTAPASEPHAEPCVEPQPEPAPVASPNTSIRLRRLGCVVLAFALLVATSLATCARLRPSAPQAPEELVSLLPESEVERPATAEPAPVEEQAQQQQDQLLLERRPPKELLPAKPQHHITINLTRQSMATSSGGGDHYRSAYWGVISVGTPAASFKVALDTGSGHLILPSTYCHSETCRAHQRYRRRQSVTAKDIDYDGAPVTPGAPRDQITVSFGTGEVVGVFVEDATCVDNDAGVFALTHSSSVVPRQMCTPLRMIMATSMSEEPFAAFEFDGVLGLGMSGLSQAPEFNFLHVMASSMKELGSTTPHMFGVFLADGDEGSEITLGGFDEQHMESELYWNPVLQPELGHWMVHIKSLRVDNQTVDFCREGCKGVLDSGTSLLSVPTPSFPEIYELLRHEADPVHRCRGSGPKLHLELDNFTVTLEPSDFAQMEPPMPGAGFASLEPTKDMCKPMLMSMEFPAPLGPKLFVLGEPVLRRYYSVFDSDPEAPRIGFSAAFHGIKEDDWADDDDELP